MYKIIDMVKTKHKMKTQLSIALSPNETLGQRLARLRTERGFSQVEFGDLVEMRQSHLSDLERGRLQINAAMAARFAGALGISTDELLGIQAQKNTGHLPRRLLRRVEQIALLPTVEQKALLKTIDAVVDRHRLRTAAAH